MRKILRNRTVIGIVCIILAFVMCFVLTPLFNRSVEAKTEIVRFSKKVSKGEQIKAGMVETLKVGNYNLPDNVIKNVNEVIGAYALTDISKGDYIMEDKLSITPLTSNDYLLGLDGTKQAVSITIQSFAAGLSGKLEEGDIISLIACNYGDLRETVVLSELKYVKVIAVTTGSGSDMTSKTMNQDPEEEELPSTITLLANEVQTKLLAELEENCKIHIALVYRGTKENAEKFLVEQDVYITANYVEEDELTGSQSEKEIELKTGSKTDNQLENQIQNQIQNQEATVIESDEQNEEQGEDNSAE